MNDSPEVSASLLWETGKAVITGKIISYSSYRKKQNQQLKNSLEQRIKQLTDIYSTNPSEQIQSELNHLKIELDNIIHQKTQFIIQQLKHQQYQYSNKTSKYLANQLKHKK